MGRVVIVMGRLALAVVASLSASCASAPPEKPKNFLQYPRPDQVAVESPLWRCIPKTYPANEDPQCPVRALAFVGAPLWINEIRWHRGDKWARVTLTSGERGWLTAYHLKRLRIGQIATVEEAMAAADPNMVLERDRKPPKLAPPQDRQLTPVFAQTKGQPLPEGVLREGALTNQKLARSAAFGVGVSAITKGCKMPESIQPYIVSMPSGTVGERSWRERWFVNGCDKNLSVDVLFQEDGRGGATWRVR